MANFTIDTDAVRQKGDAVDGLSQEYSSLSLRLRNVANSMGTAYESADNREYIQRVNECCDYIDQMATKLNSVSVLLKEQSVAYDNQEIENLGQAQKL